LTNQENIPQL